MQSLEVTFQNMLDEWVPSHLLVKVASRCNLNCTYCYWFRDPSVYRLDKLMQDGIRDQLCTRIEEHIISNKLETFSVTFHGGEPTLYGVEKTGAFCNKLLEIEYKTGCKIHFKIQSNGLLINDAWCDLFKAFDFQVGISIDGPSQIHNLTRVTHSGQGSFYLVNKAIELLTKHGIDHGILAVCNPNTDPSLVLEYFVKQLGQTSFDILIPDLNHDNKVESISDYYIKLFDLWFHSSKYKNVQIRLFENMVRVLLGSVSKTESVGFGPMSVIGVNVDGTLEPVDTLRIAGESSVKTSMHISKNKIMDVKNDELIKKTVLESVKLPDACMKCEFVLECGGGYLPHRYSKENGYQNPSVYCEDLKKIYRHIEQSIEQELIA